MTTEDPWQFQAVCAGIGGDVFFPDPRNASGIRTAVAICQRCPVRLDCLDHALTHNEEHGIWGGVIPAIRYRMRRRAA